jgi:hypothetical protein
MAPGSAPIQVVAGGNGGAAMSARSGRNREPDQQPVGAQNPRAIISASIVPA